MLFDDFFSTGAASSSFSDCDPIDDPSDGRSSDGLAAILSTAEGYKRSRTTSATFPAIFESSARALNVHNEMTIRKVCSTNNGILMTECRPSSSAHSSRRKVEGGNVVTFSNHSGCLLWATRPASPMLSGKQIDSVNFRNLSNFGVTACDPQ